MRVVFNELSTCVLAGSLFQAREWMESLIRAIATLANGHPVELATIRNWDLYGVELSTRYTISQWSHDPNADRDLRVFFRKITTKVGLPDDVADSIKDRFYLSEFRLPGQPYSDMRGPEARGLGMAFLLGALAVSLPSEDRWRDAHVQLRQVWYEYDGSEKQLHVEVANISLPSTARRASQDLLLQAQAELRLRPTRLAEKKQECFPHLRFGLDVDGQIAELPASTLALAVQKLAVLDAVVRDWRKDKKGPLLNVPRLSGESGRTMQEFGDKRTFRSSSGDPTVFERHIRIGRAYRIHCRVEQETRSVEIGYIGKHLPTARFPQ